MGVSFVLYQTGLQKTHSNNFQVLRKIRGNGSLNLFSGSKTGTGIQVGMGRYTAQYRYINEEVLLTVLDDVISALRRWHFSPFRDTQNLILISVVEPEPQGAGTYGWSRYTEVSAPTPSSGSRSN